jgi:hypothetical protein
MMQYICRGVLSLPETHEMGPCDSCYAKQDRFRKIKVTFFSHMWRIDPKDKHIHTYTNDRKQMTLKSLALG